VSGLLVTSQNGMFFSGGLTRGRRASCKSLISSSCIRRVSWFILLIFSSSVILFSNAVVLCSSSLTRLFCWERLYCENKDTSNKITNTTVKITVFAFMAFSFHVSATFRCQRATHSIFNCTPIIYICQYFINF